jgi:hypothetical protein
MASAAVAASAFFFVRRRSRQSLQMKPRATTIVTSPNGDDWLNAIKSKVPELIAKGQALGFNFVSGQRPRPNAKGHIATTLEWSRKIGKEDIDLLKGEAAIGEKVPDPDAGFTQADVQDANKREKVFRTIRERLDKFRKERPGGYLVREAPEADVKALKQLVGHVTGGSS